MARCNLDIPARYEPPVRLKLGMMVVGPDFFGCSNTGRAAVLLKSKRFKTAPANLNRQGYRFAVGPQLFAEQAVRDYLLGEYPAKPNQGFVEYDGGQYSVTFFKTYAQAKARFAFLVREQLTENARMAASELDSTKGRTHAKASK